MHELDKQRAVLAMRRRLLERDKLTRSQLRLSCVGATDAEFQTLLAEIVAGGIATRTTGKRGGEWFQGVAYAK